MSEPKTEDHIPTETIIPGETTVCVIGLGYIGLPTASVLATKGFRVFGMDVRQDVVDTINAGKIHIEDTQGRSVTVRHLLSHTSGVPNYTSLYARTGRQPVPRAEVVGREDPGVLDDEAVVEIGAEGALGEIRRGDPGPRAVGEFHHLQNNPIVLEQLKVQQHCLLQLLLFLTLCFNFLKHIF